MVEYTSGRSGPNGQEWTNWTDRAIPADLLISRPYPNAPLLLYSITPFLCLRTHQQVYPPSTTRLLPVK